MNKRKVRIATALFAAAVALLPVSASAEEMKAMYDYSQVQTMMYNGAELVPLRDVAETLGYKVAWNDMDRSVMLTMDKSAMMDKKMDGAMMDKKMDDSMMDKKMDDAMMDKKMDGAMMDKKMDGAMMDMSRLMIKVGSNMLVVNGSEKMSASAAVIINDKTYVGKDVVDQFLMSNNMMK